METMKAVICTAYGPADVLRIAERPRPSPREDEVLIRVRAASVTNSDIFIRSSAIPLWMRIPMRIRMGITKPRRGILGEVLSGTVEAVGPRITRFRAGDDVFGLTGFSFGAYAQYTCMKESGSMEGCLAIKPKNLSFEEATGAAYGGLLAFQALEKADLKPGRKVLIYGASGTSGTVAVQLARHLGAEVTAVCGPSHLGLVGGLGAGTTIDYTDASQVDRLQTYDLVVDCVGKARTSPLKQACRGALTVGGRYVSIDDSALELSPARLDRIRDLVERGAIKVISDRSFTLDQVAEAHRYVERGHKTGNVAITVDATA